MFRKAVLVAVLAFNASLGISTSANASLTLTEDITASSAAAASAMAAPTAPVARKATRTKVVSLNHTKRFVPAFIHGVTY